MPKYNICIVPEGQSSCDEMLPSSGFLGRGYSSAEDEDQVRSNYQKLVDKGKIESIGPADEIIVKKHPLQNSKGEITNYQWRIFPSDVRNTSDYSQKDSERQMSTDLENKTAELQELASQLQTKNTDLDTCHRDLEAKNSELEAKNAELKRVTSSLSEGGRRKKTKKYGKKRKSIRKKYTKRRKYSRRSRSR
jgi:polyhydroxyalkanoate synthesis regulator phasin